ncbi:Hsp20/alpha crystallin family protein [Halomonas kalidii]|uniref:Hsp20/alpha crystallin family protein n=1 Tax=Halomonas kalidii TaxID=3043293 RepID=A0ABT6VPT3_9GAMM|nr:Hsp20/alpha crystallin family protein [Halomonas kalidii]MDI5935990.1 Hsp20/alpha crystallin family protein [Halomonas kalidii]
MAKKAPKDVPVSTKKSPQQSESRAMSPFREFDRMLDSFFDRGWMPSRWEHPLWQRFAAFEKGMPKVDVIDRDAEVVVRAEVPGFESKELDVSVTDGAVTIKGDHRDESKEEEGEYFHSEISRASFTRTVALPSEIDAGKAAASFKNGVLELTLPKLKQANRRKVEIK